MTMRKGVFSSALCAIALLSSHAHAQVSDAERAAARDLFKQGDELQHAAKFADALDKFQRAQQVFSAPTNMLRIAECQAWLGRLVESAESYRAVVRTPLPAGSPQAFQAAVDQAKGELGQLEPRVPKVIVQVTPGEVSGVQLHVDGQNVPAALVGEPIPLDPGVHRVSVSASGYAGSEQSVTLGERDAKTVSFALRPIASVAYAQSTPQPPPTSSAPAAAANSPPSSVGPADSTPGAAPPGPPQQQPVPPPPPPQPTVVRPSASILLGAHFGWEVPAGTVPLPASSNQSSTDIQNVSGSGLAVAFDGGFRFARHWYVGMTVEHASLGQGTDISQLGSGNATNVSSDTTLLGLVLAVIVNPDRASAYFEVGLASRWYNFTQTNSDGTTVENHYPGPEGLFGVGLWIPAGNYVRLLPKATVSVGTFTAPGLDSSTPGASQAHAFVMLGLEGFFNLDL
jgi:hypothetical protein